MKTVTHDDDQPFPDFETRADARYSAERLIENLAKSRTESHRALAKKLDQCASDDPCLSGACPRCLRAHRVRWIADICKLVQDEWRHA
jgi:hypothetical protein